MTPILATIIRAKWRNYRKKHPAAPNTEEEIQKELENLVEYHKTRSTDVYAKQDGDFKGLDIETLTLSETNAYIFSQASNPTDKIVYYMHGGGFAAGSPAECSEFIGYFVKHFGYNMCAVDYREIPEYNIRDILGDCEEGYKKLLERYKPENICFGGGSAGGHLVFSLSHKLKDDGIPLPGGLISVSPVMQFERYAYSYYECSGKTDLGITFGINERVYPSLKGDLDYTHKYVSPLAGDFTGFPRTYLDTSDRESLRDDARMTYVKLMEAGVDVEYHELEGFMHDQAPQVKLGYVRRIEHKLLKNFLKKIFE